MKNLVFITGNEDKYREFQELLQGVVVSRRKLDLPELQGTPEEIVKEKARVAASRVQEPCIVDDTSLCFTAWGGMPGPYIKDFITHMGVERLSRTLIDSSEDVSAVAITSIGYCEPGKEAVCVQGKTPGTITPPKGNKNFQAGWDSIFVPEGGTKTYAQMSSTEKHKTSQRRKAIEAFKEFMKKE